MASVVRGFLNDLLERISEGAWLDRDEITAFCFRDSVKGLKYYRESYKIYGRHVGQANKLCAVITN